MERISNKLIELEKENLVLKSMLNDWNKTEERYEKSIKYLEELNIMQIETTNKLKKENDLLKSEKLVWNMTCRSMNDEILTLREELEKSNTVISQKEIDFLLNSNLINWNDEYKTKLCIEHHINEVKRKFEKYVDIKADLSIVNEAYNSINSVDNEKAQEQAKIELDKELIDLWLLTESYISQIDLEELVKNRIKIFSEKSK